ncbi:unnamed protein product [Clonostachys rosea f. rosea IK726]|uniref:Uncharacterized protein n=1 Tax=Clonostachys rosea f. rosea IK726 TaxID=1349383 RepID=A0ACA9UQ92_BIOOC|nr:unnamed protein product [Clonostachys rosea f. rosea IK726]
MDELANLDELPSEIKSMIINGCDKDDLQALLLTSTRLKDVVERKLYEEITLDETESKGDAVMAIANSPRAGIVRTIIYAPHDPQSMASDDHDTEIELSEATAEVLRSLRKFPGLETFRFRCDFGGWDYNNWPHGAFHFWMHTREMAEGALAAESEEPCRRLLNGSLVALCESAGAFKALELYNLPPIPTQEGAYSVFRTDKWLALVRGLKSFDLQLAGCEGGGALNMTCAHQEYIADFMDHTIRNLTSVERLRLAGEPEGTIGHYDEQESFEWTVLDLPCLKEFELEWSSFESGLPQFLAKHAKRSLEEIHLRRCFTMGLDAWEQILKGIQESQPPKLVKVRIEPYPVLKSTTFGGGENYDDLPPRFVEKWEQGEVTFDVELDRRFRRFVIAETCESYGALQIKDDDYDSDLEGEEFEDQMEEFGSDLDEAKLDGDWKAVQDICARNSIKAAKA